jgi:isocitrate dehydrogenase
MRKALGLYANVRPVVAFHPFIRTKHPKLDVVIVRENEEDLYAGIEHRQTDQVYQALKLITRPGCEKIVRYGFEYAVRHNRKKVAVFVKDNIMKLTDGLFHQVFKDIGAEYQDLIKESWIIDIGAARLADTPEIFDVIVTLNLYGDIISDIAAQIGGSVGLGGSANIGDQCAMFEAIHGSAPPIAGLDIANPSGLLFGAIQMLVHIGQPAVATRIHNAWLRTIEEGIHTTDIFKEGTSRQKVGTRAFGEAVVERLGEVPQELAAVHYAENPPRMALNLMTHRRPAAKDLFGVDVFLDWTGPSPDHLAAKLQACLVEGLNLVLITNRGVKVWPNGWPETFTTDHWRCRFRSTTRENTINHRHIIDLLSNIERAGLDFIKTEHLYNFDGAPGYSLGQGE